MTQKEILNLAGLALREKVDTRQAVTGIIGLGYFGLPLTL